MKRSSSIQQGLNGWHRDREVNWELYDLEILARLQHYGAATCLLDFTRSFHVALWFACQKGELEKNGKMFIVRTDDVNSFKKIERKDIEEKKLSELLYDEKTWYWDLENLTDRVARQNSVFILGENNLSEGEQYKSFEIDHGDKNPLIKEMEDLFDLRPESLFKDIFGFASVNGRNDPLLSNDSDAYFKAGNQSYQRRDYGGAIKHYSKAIKLKPDFVEAYFNRGFAHEQELDFDRAIEDYSTVINLRPNATAYHHRGIVYLKQLKTILAIKDFTKAIELDPKNAAVYRNRGVAYELIGESDKAKADFAAVKRLVQL